MLRIRPAHINEQAALEALQRRASLVDDEYRTQLLAEPDAIQLPLEQIAQGCVQVAERDGVVVGFSVVLRRQDGQAELDGLFVEPDAWRSGIGTRLVRAAERRAVRDGATSLNVIANPAAEAFYTACGFDASGAEHTRFGRAHRMRKALVQAGRSP